MLEFSDAPYRFFEARPSAPLIQLGRGLNRHLILPGIRSKIHRLRTDSNATPHPEIDGLADRAILALRIHGYLTPYLTENPTMDRYAETVERIAEDFYSHAMPRTGSRRAMVKIHAPIDLRDFFEMKLRDALPALTGKMESTVQAGIDSLNESNDAPGAGMAG